MCKGRWLAAGETEGLSRKAYEFASAFGRIARFLPHNPSVTFGDSSLYTREPFCLRNAEITYTSIPLVEGTSSVPVVFTLITYDGNTKIGEDTATSAASVRAVLGFSQ